MNSIAKFLSLTIVVMLVLALALSNIAYAFVQRTDKCDVEKLEFRAEKLYISQTNAPLEQVINQLANATEWHQFLAKEKGSIVYIDPRSGKPASLITAIPLLPGDGYGNHILMSDISKRLGYEVQQIQETDVKHLIMNFIRENSGVLGLNVDEIGKIRTGHPVDYLWQISISRKVKGIQVRDAYLSLTINHGNLIVWGVEKWGDIDVSLIPRITKEDAVQIGFAFVGGRTKKDRITNDATLELIPTAPSTYSDTQGKGYSYALVGHLFFSAKDTAIPGKYWWMHIAERCWLSRI